MVGWGSRRSTTNYMWQNGGIHSQLGWQMPNARVGLPREVFAAIEEEEGPSGVKGAVRYPTRGSLVAISPLRWPKNIVITKPQRNGDISHHMGWWRAINICCKNNPLNGRTSIGLQCERGTFFV